jgi:hypothetical protein
MKLPELPGVLTGRDVGATAATIAQSQEPDGAIPWFRGGHTDPWDHVECAMALDVAGLHDSAERAYEWLRRRQRADGSWAARYEQGRIADDHTDANFCGYVATGVWHHFRSTGDRGFLHRMWPTVARALDLVVGLQMPGGQIAWGSGEGGPIDEALLTSSSSLYQALRAGLAVSAELGGELPDWELAAGRLGHAVQRHPERFRDKSRFSMDWYYPILGGAVRGPGASDRIAARWDEFWVEGLGVRCVADRPWVTGAETCELALTLDAMGERDAAIQAVTAMQHLRDPDGSYWTGYVFADDARWPLERSTWTGAAVILAVDAITQTSPGAGIFRGTDLPVGVDPRSVVCAAEVELDRVGSAVLCETPQ